MLDMVNKVMAYLVSAIVLFSGGIPSVSDYDGSDYTGLKDVYADYFDIGTAAASCYCQDGTELSDFILKNYSSITAATELKIEILNPSENVWNFAGADMLAKYCREHNLKFRGHCLVWGQLDNWMLYDDNGNFVDKEVFYSRLYDYMKVIMTRYADVVSCWDVTNEVFGYDKTSDFKNYPIYQLCGEEYIEKAFTFAREILPDATLVLNETGLARNMTKQTYLFKWLKIWREKGITIDAIGIQGHYSTVSVNETTLNLGALINRLRNFGIDNIMITEMDLSCYNDYSDKTVEPAQWVRDLQTLKYKNMFELFRENRDIISSVTFWGPCDGNTWLNANGSLDEPYVFTADYKPKAAYYAITDF